MAGGNFNFGNRTSAQCVSTPKLGLGFIYGGSTPYMNGMIRFDATNPDQLLWTNETLTNGSYGTQVPNLNAGLADNLCIRYCLSHMVDARGF